jgi:predicted amidophosphoribosyltransferase
MKEMIERIISGKKDKTINNKIKICVGCGSTLVLIEQDTISCRDCGKEFKLRGGKNGFHL